MSIFLRTRGLSTLEKALTFNFVHKSSFHAISRTPMRAPLPGWRSFFFKVFRKPSQAKMKKSDDIPDEFDLIYRNAMSRYILGAQIVSVVTGGLVILSVIWKSDFKPRRRQTLRWSEKSRTTENEELYYISILIVFLVVMQVLVARTPIRIYKVPGTPKYISINYGNLFGKVRYSFQRGEISRSPGFDFIPWKESQYVIEKERDRKSVILLEYFFRRPADLSIMLGEQSDPDLEEMKPHQH